jgi:uncharacterized membrane protein YciS (DUF1049 family)
MAWFKKAFYIGLSLLVMVMGLWLVVVNDQQISLNLMIAATPRLNAGLVVLASFALGGVVGILVGLNLITVFRLNSRVFWLKRDLKQLQDELTERRSKL